MADVLLGSATGTPRSFETFETYEDKLNQLSKQFPLSDEVLFFPENTVEIKREEKKREKGFVVVPSDADDPNLQEHIKECFNYFNQQDIKIIHPHKEYNKDPKIQEEKLSKKKYECDVSKKKKVENNFDILASEPQQKSPRSMAKDVDFQKESVSVGRNYIHKHMTNHLFRVYDMSTTSSEFEWDGGAERNICKRYKQKSFTSKIPIMLEIKKFTPLLFSKFGEIEPVFLTICLFDIAAKKRISENFYVDTNTDEIMTDIPTFSREKSVRVKRAVFNVSRRSADVVLFIQVSKILQGDEDSSTKAYTSIDSLKQEADVKKVEKDSTGFFNTFERIQTDGRLVDLQRV
ncbi:dedicator of cytokinesis protein [Acrasis kona]|uniref:Dedicator of cytokinesis protein n=1 Tax=Acrasis kona TaxID=1008807 RepID=A0AAW2Z8Y3_9EUKA